MWLLDTTTLTLTEFFDSNTPPYAILSHTWGADEISFPEMQGAQAAVKEKAGYHKVANFCRLAYSRGYKYGWADTCCIDKRNSADLSEAINSMFRYYRDSGECLIYLSDVPGQAESDAASQQQLEAFKASRWFTRGWTLQELIAPKKRIFYSTDWNVIDDGTTLVHLLVEVTNIDADLLNNRIALSTFCTAERMSWASLRQTTRAEDMAYSLMGLFNINMPVLYGEGAQNAFRRLQEQILRTSFDQSIFVWKGPYESSGLLAKSLSDFKDTPLLGLWGPFHLSPSTMTNVGLCLRMNVIPVIPEDRSWLPIDLPVDAHMGVVACDVRTTIKWRLLILHLEPVPEATFYANGKLCKAYRRVMCDSWMGVNLMDLKGRTGPSRAEDVLVLEDENYELVHRALADHQSRKGLPR